MSFFHLHMYVIFKLVPVPVQNSGGIRLVLTRCSPVTKTSTMTLIILLPLFLDVSITDRCIKDYKAISVVGLPQR